MLVQLMELADAQQAPTGSSFQWNHFELSCASTIPLFTIIQHTRVENAPLAAQFWRRCLVQNALNSLTLSSLMDLNTFQGLCSAIATSEVPLEVAYQPRYGLDREDDGVAVSRWAWLAFALFRGQAARREPIRVYLNLTRFTLTVARAIERVVRARDPAVELRSLAGINTSTIIATDVVGDTCACVIEQLSLAIPFAAPLDIDATVLLLETIGAGVKRLQFQCQCTQLDVDPVFWSNIRAACPSLERLDDAYASLNSLTWLVDTSMSQLRRREPRASSNRARPALYCPRDPRSSTAPEPL